MENKNQSVNDMPAPMSDADVSLINKKISKLDNKTIDEILSLYDKYKVIIISLLTSLKNKVELKKDEESLVDIEQVIRIAKFCPSDELFIRSKDKIWYARNYIMKKDAEWFINKNMDKNIKNDGKKAMIENILKSIKNQWKQFTQVEREEYWKFALQILRIVAEFKKLSKE
jgi:hypothetical protein